MATLQIDWDKLGDCLKNCFTNSGITEDNWWEKLKEIRECKLNCAIDELGDTNGAYNDQVYLH